MTVYLITDEQYLRSKGKVRCGTCRTPFQANFFGDTPKLADTSPPSPSEQPAIENKITAASKNVEIENSTEKVTIPSFDIQVPNKEPAPFDDKLLPIDNDEAKDPKSDQPEKGVSVDSFIADKINLVSVSGNDEDSFSFETELSVNDLSDEELAKFAVQYADEDDIDTGKITEFDHGFKSNIQSELSIEMGDEVDDLDEEIDVESQPEPTEADPHETEQTASSDLDSGSSRIDQSSPHLADSLEQRDVPEVEKIKPELDQSLISKMDDLIDSKLVSETEKENTDQDETLDSSSENLVTEADVDSDVGSDVELEVETDINSEGLDDDEESFELLLDKPFILDQPVNKIHRWVYSPIFMVVGLVLLCGLAYQLWLRQAVPLLENQQLAEVIATIAGPAAIGLKEKFDVRLPIRRDLANLQLVSARTETHPTRASTTLLKVSMVNQSQIAQPFPWLELSLTDENGRLVARRAMSPDDYLYNNRLDNLIGANELRPITIELLSFPEQARGYELKLLSN